MLALFEVLSFKGWVDIREALLRRFDNSVSVSSFSLAHGQRSAPLSQEALELLSCSGDTSALSGPANETQSHQTLRLALAHFIDPLFFLSCPCSYTLHTFIYSSSLDAWLE